MLVTFIKVTTGIGFAMPGVTGQGLTLPTGQVADQEKSVPVTVELKATGAVDVPEHIDCPARHEITAVGLTWMARPMGGPAHPFA